MKSREVNITKVVFNSSINGYCRKGRIDDALRIYNVMEKKWFQADAFSYNNITRYRLWATQWKLPHRRVKRNVTLILIIVILYTLSILSISCFGWKPNQTYQVFLFNFFLLFKGYFPKWWNRVSMFLPFPLSYLVFSSPVSLPAVLFLYHFLVRTKFRSLWRLRSSFQFSNATSVSGPSLTKDKILDYQRS